MSCYGFFGPNSESFELRSPSGTRAFLCPYLHHTFWVSWTLRTSPTISDHLSGMAVLRPRDFVTRTITPAGSPDKRGIGSRSSRSWSFSENAAGILPVVLLIGVTIWPPDPITNWHITLVLAILWGSITGVFGTGLSWGVLKIIEKQRNPAR